MELLEQHFDAAFVAPNGIKKLRELILTLAMQGKLVPQDPNDPPASQLLKEIEVEKKRLVKAGKIKVTKPLPAIKQEDVPYALPQGWEWVRLGDVGETNIGLTYSPINVSNTGIPVLRSNNIQSGRLDLSDLKRVDMKVKESLLVQKGDLLICARNGSKALVGKTALVAGLSEEMAFGAFMAIFRSRVNQYLFYFINSPLFRRMIDEVSTMTINQITQDNLRSTIFPLPSLPEQHRIVAKIDQLMARCDKLEKLSTERKQKRRSVHTAALKSLLDAQASDSFVRAWQFITQNFGELYAVKENVTELRKGILQLGVTGKLVPQNPNDPPASQLLKDIQFEKKRLVKEGKIRLPKPLLPIVLEQMPYSLPLGWTWVRLAEISDINGGFAFKSSHYVNDGIRVVRISDFDGRGFKNDKVVRYTYSIDLRNYQLETNNILIAMTGGTVGKSLLVLDLPEPMVVNQRVATIRLVEGMVPEFVNTVIQTDSIQQVIQHAKNSTNDNISMADIDNFLVPLPSFPEQNRIVAKINQLMARCDELEQYIVAATGKQTELLNAVMA